MIKHVYNRSISDFLIKQFNAEVLKSKY